jgi:hypothetical protein
MTAQLTLFVGLGHLLRDGLRGGGSSGGSQDGSGAGGGSSIGSGSGSTGSTPGASAQAINLRHGSGSGAAARPAGHIIFDAC